MSLMSSSTRIYEVVAGNQPNRSGTPVGVLHPSLPAALVRRISASIASVTAYPQPLILGETLFHLSQAA
jgi:hypothetical protein